MAEITPAAKSRSRQIVCNIKFKQQLRIYVEALSSLDEQTFNIGKLINQMKTAGIKNEAIADSLREHDRFKQFTPGSLKETVRVWSKGVHHLIKDYGHNGDDFKQVYQTLKKENNIELTAHVIRNYSGDIATVLQTGANHTNSISSIYSNLDEEDGVESMSEIVENLNETNHKKREEKVRLKVVKVVPKRIAKDHYEDITSQFVNIKTIPSVSLPLYIRFTRNLSCCWCSEKKASGLFKLDSEYLPMSDHDSDLLSVPMCVSCKAEIAEGRIKFTQSEKSLMLFKYTSIFIQAMAIDRQNELL